MRQWIAALVCALGMFLFGIMSAGAEGFKDKDTDVVTAQERAKRYPVSYNTRSYNAAVYNPWRAGEVFRVPETYNDRSGYLGVRPTRTRTGSYTRFPCRVIDPYGFNDSANVQTTCR